MEIEILAVIIKIGLLVGTFFHFVVSLIALRQVRQMNRMISTAPSGCITGCNVFLSVFLLVVFVLVLLLL